MGCPGHISISSFLITALARCEDLLILVAALVTWDARDTSLILLFLITALARCEELLILVAALVTWDALDTSLILSFLITALARCEDLSRLVAALVTCDARDTGLASQCHIWLPLEARGGQGGCYILTNYQENMTPAQAIDLLVATLRGDICDRFIKI